MTKPVKDDWNRKTKKYKTKYLENLGQLFESIESDDNEVREATQEVVEKLGKSIHNLSEK